MQLLGSWEVLVALLQELIGADAKHLELTI
jgi:hypothetical protein